MVRLHPPRRGSDLKENPSCRVLSPVVPRVHNSDGEDMEIFALHYRLEQGVSAEKLRAALSAAPDLDPASATFWNWLAPSNAPRARGKPKAREGTAFTSAMEHGATVLGTLELKDRTLTLHVNSEPRAERGRVMLERLLEGLVSTPLIERQTFEQALAEHRQRASSSRADPDAGRHQPTQGCQDGQGAREDRFLAQVSREPDCANSPWRRKENCL
jgi:hypothetical protein